MIAAVTRPRVRAGLAVGTDRPRPATTRPRVLPRRPARYADTDFPFGANARKGSGGGS
jgi:hypothetical protein